MSSSTEVGGAAALRKLRKRLLLPVSLRVHRQPTWWHEIAIIVVLDVIYEKLRNLVPHHEAEAINRGRAFLQFGAEHHWNVEIAANQFLMRHEWLAQIVNYDYSMLHLPVTGSILVWVFWKHRSVYRSARTVLLLTTLMGLVGFWLMPTAPPRLVPGAGFVDTVVHFNTIGSWADPTIADRSNQYAAFPSLHCAWALWCGLTVFFLAKNRWLRGIALAYPVWTVFVVLSTANHYFIDAVAGAAVVGIAIQIVVLLHGRSPWTAPDRAAAPEALGPELSPARR